jgi:hypothetical protein
LGSAGSGLILPTLLPAILAPLPEQDVAAVSATYSFIRTFGYIWGVTISGVVFNAVFDQKIKRIPDKSLMTRLQGGAGYSFASQAHELKETFDSAVWNEVVGVYTESLRAIWWICLGISIFSFFAVAFEQEVELRNELNTEYGLDDEALPDTAARMEDARDMTSIRSSR